MAEPSFDSSKVPDQAAAEALTKIVLANTFEIVDEETFIASWAMVERHDAVLKKLTVGTEDFQGFDAPVAAAYSLHKMLTNLRSQFVNPVIASKNRWLRAREAYRQKLAIEQKRIDDAAAEALRKQQQKEMQKDAKQLERQGEVEAAEVIRTQAKTLPLPVMAPRAVAPKQEGSVLTPSWEFEIENFDELAIEYKLLDHTKAGERALIESKVRADVKKFGYVKKFPGVRVWNTNKESSRSK